MKRNANIVTIITIIIMFIFKKVSKSNEVRKRSRLSQFIKKILLITDFITINDLNTTIMVGKLKKKTFNRLKIYENFTGLTKCRICHQTLSIAKTNYDGSKSISFFKIKEHLFNKHFNLIKSFFEEKTLNFLSRDVQNFKIQKLNRIFKDKKNWLLKSVVKKLRKLYLDEHSRSSISHTSVAASPTSHTSVAASPEDSRSISLTLPRPSSMTSERPSVTSHRPTSVAKDATSISSTPSVTSPSPPREDSRPSAAVTSPSCTIHSFKLGSPLDYYTGSTSLLKRLIKNNVKYENHITNYLIVCKQAQSLLTGKEINISRKKFGVVKNFFYIFRNLDKYNDVFLILDNNKLKMTDDNFKIFNYMILCFIQFSVHVLLIFNVNTFKKFVALLDKSYLKNTSEKFLRCKIDHIKIIYVSKFINMFNSDELSQINVDLLICNQSFFKELEYYVNSLILFMFENVFNSNDEHVVNNNFKRLLINNPSLSFMPGFSHTIYPFRIMSYFNIISNKCNTDSLNIPINIFNHLIYQTELKNLLQID